MTIPNSQPPAADETRRSEAPSSPTARSEGGSPDGMPYDVFISYSRHNADQADKIERDLEKYPLPREIRKRLGRRHLNVFRDLSDMTGNRLEPALELHLLNSRTLVVLCSPAARRSQYVSLEIHRFAELRDAEHIVPVLVGGGANNDPSVDAAEWAFPDALEDVLGSGPLAADLSQAWNTKSRRAKLARGSPWVQLVADIVGSTTDDLRERIAKSERRRLQSMVAILMVVLAVVGLAIFQKNRADKQFRETVATRLAEHSRSELIADRTPDVVRAIQEALASQSLSAAPDPGVMLRALRYTSDVSKVIVTGRPMFSGMDVVPNAIDMRQLNPVYGVTFSPDGRQVATAGAQVRLWDTETGKRQALFDTMLLDMSVAFRPDGRRIVTGGFQLQIWDDTGKTIGEPLKGHNGVIHSVAFSPDGQRIVSGGADDTIRVWDARVQRPIGQPVNLGADVNAVAYHPDNRRVVSGDSDGHVRIFDPSTGIPGDAISPDGLPVLAVALSPDGRRIIAGGMDPAIKMWDVDTRAAMGSAPGHTGPVTSLAFSRDGSRIVSSSLDGTVRMWNADNHRSGGHEVVGPGSADGAPPFAKGRDRARQPPHGGGLRRWDSAALRHRLGSTDRRPDAGPPGCNRLREIQSRWSSHRIGRSGPHGPAMEHRYRRTDRRAARGAHGHNR